MFHNTPRETPDALHARHTETYEVHGRHLLRTAREQVEGQGGAEAPAAEAAPEMSEEVKAKLGEWVAARPATRTLRC